MLLGSPPDMIHGFRSHRTHPSTHIPRCRPHKKHPQRRHHPCYSGFQVQDTAATPASMVLSGHRTLHIYYNRPLPLMQEQIQKICKFSCERMDGRPSLQKLRKTSAPFLLHGEAKCATMASGADISAARTITAKTEGKIHEVERNILHSRPG